MTKLLHKESVHLVIFLYISIPHPSQPASVSVQTLQSLIYTSSSPFHIPPVIEWAMAFLHLQMFPHTKRKTKYSYPLSEMPFIHSLFTISESTCHMWDHGIKNWSKITNKQITAETLEKDKIYQIRSTTVKEDTDNITILTQQNKII